ncbi:hypothetical protein Ae717Ps2_0223c [Pseudonocardia sp. Ae717_Ps2]|uniref:glycoside hydrolase family 16 protein n=1 Tax=Pseudonocardia sp. Ae717_Ps2 TaxID=1885573 RepID=UPI00095D6350|nr:glycoside hydrolase family 16 protein [Pseudonocardia sp. Ae717_Ps2]OLM29330.1 hypothetical protein Ae717Ps2_0223c [Pseudonocardia sp. Ae717_Ps2]
MTADELEQLLKSLLAKGVTVVLLALGPAGELVGVEPGGSATPSTSSGQDAAGAPRPDLELGAGGEVCVGTGSGSGSGGSGSSGSGSGDSDSSSGSDGSGSDGSGSDSSGSDSSGSDSSGGGERDSGSGSADDSAGDSDSSSDGSSTDRRGGGGDGGAGGSDDSGRSGGSGDATGSGSGSGSGSNDSERGGGTASSSGSDSGTGRDSGSGTTAAPDESGATAYGTSDDAAAGLLTGGSGTSGSRTPPPCRPSGTGGTDPAPATGSAEGTTAAAKLGWGQPVRADEFDNGTEGWSIYDGAGHAGNGRRTPDAASVADGVLTITGDSQGNTAGMAWKEGSQQYGRWEGRVRAPVGDPSYNALLLLWPTAENWPEGGELDFMEMMDPQRQKTNAFFHYGADNSQVEGSVEVDATQWHNWALEWTPDRITAYVDGEKWFETTEEKVQPPGPMHLCIQLDWFPKGGGSGKETQMQVDWVRQYTLDGGSPDATTDGGAAPGSAG